MDALAHGDSESKTIDLKSYAECVSHLIKSHKVQTLVGHSFGGLANIYACYLMPNTIKKMVVMASPCDVFLFFGGQHANCLPYLFACVGLGGSRVGVDNKV